MMLSRIIQSPVYYRYRRTPNSSLSSPTASAFNAVQNRCFFFGSSNNNNNGDDDDNNKKDDKDKKDENPQEEEKESEKEDTPSATLNNSSKYKSQRYGNSSNILLPASRLGFGDQAPRYPHLMALPVIRGPVFPGVLTPVTVTDRVRLHCLYYSLSSLQFVQNIHYYWTDTSRNLQPNM